LKVLCKKSSAISLTTMLKSITINVQIRSKFGNNISRRETRIKFETSWKCIYLLNNLKKRKVIFNNCKTISRGRFQILFCARKKKRLEKRLQRKNEMSFLITSHSNKHILDLVLFSFCIFLVFSSTWKAKTCLVDSLVISHWILRFCSIKLCCSISIVDYALFFYHFEIKVLSKECFWTLVENSNIFFN